MIFLWLVINFERCLTNLSEVLKRCEDCNLVLNWEKCHFMVKEGIVLGHHISEKCHLVLNWEKCHFMGDSSKTFQRLHTHCANCWRKNVNFVLMNLVLKHSVS